MRVMDSGNSGSLNSSSGGDDEYDSRTESISAFLNSSNQQPPLPPLHHHNHQPSSSFDPLSNLYLDPFSLSQTTPNYLLNLDMVWPKTLVGSLSSSTTQNKPAPPPSSSVSLQPTDHENGARKGSTNATGCNPKKRSRASSRAPTTVLTTDTSNFRAMVQEFTGISALPFSTASSSLFPRSRFNKSKVPISTISSNDSQLKVGNVFEEFSMNHNHSSHVNSSQHLGGLSNIVTTITTSNEISLRSNNVSTNNWGE